MTPKTLPELEREFRRLAEVYASRVERYKHDEFCRERAMAVQDAYSHAAQLCHDAQSEAESTDADFYGPPASREEAGRTIIVANKGRGLAFESAPFDPPITLDIEQDPTEGGA